MPPKLMAPERRTGRVRGKSDPIDALAVARAALREPRLSRPRPDEERLRELKLLVDHRDDLVDERRRAQQRLRWHLHQLDPTFAVPAGRSTARSGSSGSAAGSPGRSRVQVRLARELVALPLPQPQDPRARSRARAADEQNAPALLELPGCGALTAAKLLAEIGPIERFQSDAQLARHSGVAPLEASSAAPSGTASTAAATANSTPRSTGSRSPRRASTGCTRLPRTQTGRRQEPPRSAPLPQTTTRPRRLHTLKTSPALT